MNDDEFETYVKSLGYKSIIDYNDHGPGNPEVLCMLGIMCDLGLVPTDYPEIPLTRRRRFRIWRKNLREKIALRVAPWLMTYDEYED